MRFDPGLRGELSTGLSTAPVDNLERGFMPEKGFRLAGQEVGATKRFALPVLTAAVPGGPRARARRAHFWYSARFQEDGYGRI